VFALVFELSMQHI